MAEDIVHPLRVRMIEDMTARNLDERTQRGYIRSVRSCCQFCRKQPAHLTYEDVRRFQLQLMQSGLAPGSVNGAMVGLRFFFRVTLRRPEALDYIPMAREPQRLPVVMTPEEVASVLEAAPGPKWRAALSVAYGSGLRASEVVSLKVSDIDSQRMRIRVEQGKGRHDRDALLSPHLLGVLRNWWKLMRPQVWLFPNQHAPYTPVTARSLNRAFHVAARRAFSTDLCSRLRTGNAPAYANVTAH
jgi:integrase/recombinase XerD